MKEIGLSIVRGTVLSLSTEVFFWLGQCSLAMGAQHPQTQALPAGLQGKSKLPRLSNWRGRYYPIHLNLSFDKPLLKWSTCASLRKMLDGAYRTTNVASAQARATTWNLLSSVNVMLPTERPGSMTSGL